MEFFVVHLGIGGHHHRIDEIVVPSVGGTRFHRTARYEDRRDVEAHRRDEHPRGDLVAVADADQGIRFVGVYHVFDAVGDQVAAGKGVEHPVVAHRDTIVDSDCVELGREVSLLLDHRLYLLPYPVEMGVTGDELSEGVRDSEDRFPEVVLLHSICPPETPRAGHSASVGCRVAAQRVFHCGTSKKI